MYFVGGTKFWYLTGNPFFPLSTVGCLHQILHITFIFFRIWNITACSNLEKQNWTINGWNWHHTSKFKLRYSALGLHTLSITSRSIDSAWSQATNSISMLREDTWIMGGSWGLWASDGEAASSGILWWRERVMGKESNTQTSN